MEEGSREKGGGGETRRGRVKKEATMEKGLEIRVPLFIKQGEKGKVATEDGALAGRA